MAQIPNETLDLDPIVALVDADIARMIARYGAQAVKQSVKRHTTRRSGRPAENDGPLSEFLRDDARHWLEENELPRRSARSIASAYATKYVGHNQETTARRIMGKLSGRVGYYTLVEAVWLSGGHYPYAAHLRTLEALSNLGIHDDLWAEYLGHAEAVVSRYRMRFGPPDANMTIREVEAKSSKPAAAPAAPAGTAANILQALHK